jgi:hypothetical protein
MSSLILWLDDISLIWLGTLLLVSMTGVALAGYAFRTWRKNAETGTTSEGQEGYIVSAILGLLALLLGFTMSLAIDRFETRRQLVLEQANAIGTAYLHAQILAEPHRTRITKLLIAYTDNELALASANPHQTASLIEKDNTLLTDMGAATVAGFDSIKNLDFSSTFVDSMDNLFDLDIARREARQARVPGTVFVVLLIYLIVTAGALGYVLSGPNGRHAAAFLLALFTMSLLLIIDIDRPTSGSIQESQVQMQRLRAALTDQPISTYDRWRTKSQEP